MNDKYTDLTMYVTVSFKLFSQLQLNTFIEPEDGVDAENLPTFLTSCFICPCLFQPDTIQLSVFQS